MIDLHTRSSKTIRAIRVTCTHEITFKLCEMNAYTYVHTYVCYVCIVICPRSILNFDNFNYPKLDIW